MKITDILDIADKRTKGLWFCMKDGFSRKQKVPTVYMGDDELRYIAFCDDFMNIKPTNNEANAEYISIAPEMESKLRSIVDMLPEIKTSIRWLINTYEKQGSPVIVEKDLLTKLEKWENE